jgi:hypothetical protein
MEQKTRVMCMIKGGIRMKLRRLSLVVVLVALSAILLAAPVQAGRSVTPFRFGFQECNVPVDPGYSFTERNSGPVVHLTFDMWGTVTGSDPRVTGYFTLESIGPIVVPNPHNTDVAFWGPGDGTWCLAGPNGSGWKGSSHVHAQNDMAKWPDSFLVRAKGVGYGDYEGLRIEFTVRTLWDMCPYVFEGEIAENSR